MNPLKTLVSVGSASVMAVLLSACSATGAGKLPAVAVSTDHRAPGHIVWCDLLSNDVPVASAFYGSLLGWEYRDFSEDPTFRVAYAGKKPVAGLTDHHSTEEGETEPLWICSVSVDDVDAIVALAAKHGGSVTEAPWDAKPRGRVAVVEDPQGAPLAILRSADGDPFGKIPVGAWAWFDYFAQDPEGAKTFFRDVLGYRAGEPSDDGRSIRLMSANGDELRAAIIDVGDLPVESNWLPYVRVADLGDVIARTPDLGGRVLLVVNDAAVIEDPTGAAIGVLGPLMTAEEDKQ